MPKWTRWFIGVGLAMSASSVEKSALASECLTSSGKTACGFHCVASDGQVRCAQTREGVCTIASGVVVCWDPPPAVRRVFGDRVPQASCLSTSYRTACGYSCETSNDQVQCAQTPFGECQVSDGRLVCWDPPAAVMLAKRLRTPVAECISSSGKMRCGYHCLSRDGVLRCAQTPEGSCSVEQGQLVCWDPPLDTYGVVFEPSAELACIDGVEGRSCGYRCVASLMYSGCGADRGDSCRFLPDRLVCANPD